MPVTAGIPAFRRATRYIGQKAAARGFLADVFAPTSRRRSCNYGQKHSVSGSLVISLADRLDSLACVEFLVRQEVNTLRPRLQGHWKPWDRSRALAFRHPAWLSLLVALWLSSEANLAHRLAVEVVMGTR